MTLIRVSVTGPESTASVSRSVIMQPPVGMHGHLLLYAPQSDMLVSLLPGNGQLGPQHPLQRCWSCNLHPPINTMCRDSVIHDSSHLHGLPLVHSSAMHVQLFALGIGGACANVQHNPGVARVYGIFLGDTLVTAGAQLGGQLSPQLGLLSELRYLDLRGLGLQVTCIALHVHPVCPSWQAIA